MLGHWAASDRRNSKLVNPFHDRWPIKRKSIFISPRITHQRPSDWTVVRRILPSGIHAVKFSPNVTIILDCLNLNTLHCYFMFGDERTGDDYVNIASSGSVCGKVFIAAPFFGKQKQNGNNNKCLVGPAIGYSSKLLLVCGEKILPSPKKKGGPKMLN